MNKKIRFALLIGLVSAPLMSCTMVNVGVNPCAPVKCVPIDPPVIPEVKVEDLPPAYEQPEFDVVPGGGRSSDTCGPFCD